jgi:hypothetical protein
MLGKMILNNNSRLLLIIKSAIAEIKKFNVMKWNKGMKRKDFVIFKEKESGEKGKNTKIDY